MARPAGEHPILRIVSRALDMLVLTRLTDTQVDKPPVIDLSAVDAGEFWRQSAVADPAPVRVVSEWTPLEGPGWRALELQGPSGGPGTHTGNRRFFASAHVRRDRSERAPVVLAIHGYAIPFTGFDRWLAWRMRRHGASTIRPDLPFHLRRTVPGRASGDGFFSIDPAHTRAVLRQAVEDCAALVAWARSEVSPRVSVVGTSLGGLVATLLGAVVELDSVLAIAPLLDPAASFTERPPGAMQRRMGMLGEGDGFWGRDRKAARAVLEGALAPLVPRNLTPKTPGDRITLVRPDNDLIVGPAPIDELATLWGAELWTYPHGHITVMNAPGMARRVVERAVRVRVAPDRFELAG